MAGKKIAVKKHVVRLSAEEREQLASLIRSGKRAAQLLTKARILLKADVSEAGEGWSVFADASAHAKGCRNQIENRGQTLRTSGTLDSRGKMNHPVV